MHVEWYHGAAREFARFNSPRRDPHPSKIGLWFTECRETAAIIARQAARCCDDEPTVLTVRLYLQHPKVYQTYRDFLDDLSDRGRGSSQTLRRSLAARGHDGIEIARSDTDGGPVRRDVAVFSAGQVEILDREPLDAPGFRP